MGRRILMKTPKLFMVMFNSIIQNQTMKKENSGRTSVQITLKDFSAFRCVRRGIVNRTKRSFF